MAPTEDGLSNRADIDYGTPAPSPTHDIPRCKRQVSWSSPMNCCAYAACRPYS
ncbi:hypothetical protein [Paenibacillus harenae]|uniref:hypothetical protein n=1 Tax=Paenibacillus harenae TaxID=306543 RepID=UPI00278DEDBB|nr:hypothetical protein [Paenibacillus harenae]MDQ0058495.1 hypothetical protein [Paenibacillus harenae]